jgi:hypothetical protein
VPGTPPVHRQPLPFAASASAATVDVLTRRFSVVGVSAVDGAIWAGGCSGAVLLSKDEDYAWARPALLEAKLRKVELAAGHPAAKGRRQGRAHAYNSQEVRKRERAWLAQAEHAYTRFVANWQTRPPEGRTDAANVRMPPIRNRAQTFR